MINFTIETIDIKIQIFKKKFNYLNPKQSSNYSYSIDIK